MIEKRDIALWVLGILLVSFFALHAHVHERGFAYINQGNQVVRHEQRLAGASVFFNPWQYRILTPWAVEILVTAYERFELENPYFSAFTHFRFLQHLVIFGLCFAYYRRFAPDPLLSLFGVVLLGYAMSYSVWDSDLSFDTYTDVILFLLAFLALERGRTLWILPLSVLAAANRETGVMIPLFAVVLAVRTWRPFRVDRRALSIAIASAVAFAAVALGVRAHYGFAPNKVSDGLKWLVLNVTDARTYFYVLGVVNVAWLLPIFFFRDLTPFLRRAFVLIVPVWFATHYMMVPVAESRLFLVPQAVILIPVVLHLLEHRHKGRDAVA